MSPRLRIRLGASAWRTLALAFLFTLVSVALAMSLPVLLRDIVDALPRAAEHHTRLLGQCALFLALVLLSALASRYMRWFPMRLGPVLATHMRADLFRHWVGLDDAQLSRHRIGDRMARLTSDVPAVAEMVSQGLTNLARAGLSIALAFVIMARSNRELTLVMAVLLPLMVLIGLGLLLAIRKRYQRVQEHYGRISTFCEETFSGIRVVKSMGLEDRRQRAFGGLNQDFIRLNLRLSRAEIPAWPTMHFGFLLGNIALLYVGGGLVLEERLSLGTLVQFQQYLMLLQWPTLSLSWTISLILRGRASLRRVRELAHDSPTLVDPVHQPPATLTGGIRFEQVSLRLNERDILREVTFALPPGACLGITGPTGSGKSMLAHLLVRRFDPSAGQVLLDGHALPEVPLTQLRRHVRLAEQEPSLFSRSLAENLRFGCPDASDEDLLEALHLAGFDEDLARMPQGLNTPIGEYGITLSGGQRQRCGIARALLNDPAVLILDDAFSAVDTRTERLILERLRPALRQRTSLIISHRASALRGCDLLLVLENGRVSAFDTPDAVARQNGYYARLLQQQELHRHLEDADA